MAIATAFVTGWSAAAPDVPFALRNEALPSSDTFALLTVTMTTGGQLTSGGVGERFVGRNGWIVVKLWTPTNQGTARMDALIELVKGVFEMKNIPGPVASDEAIDTGVTTPQDGGEDGRWFMMLARTPFVVYETK